MAARAEVSTKTNSGEHGAPRITLEEPIEESEPLTILNTAGLVPPRGEAEILELYGNVRDYVQDDGTLKPSWTRERAAYVRCPWEMFLSWDKSVRVKRLQVHVEIKDVLEEGLAKIDEKGLGSELRFYGGGFNFRPQRGSGKKLSMHAFIAAWDFNPEENPLGSDPLMHRGVVRILETLGFTWGGRWTRQDGMHFQWAKGY